MNFLLAFFTAAHALAAYHYIEIDGSINPGSSNYIVENITRAETAGADGLIVRINTPGGLLSSTRDIIQAINQSKVPVIVHVGPGGASATSAGALIALSAHVVSMAPGANMGAAHPVGSGGEEVKGPMGDKVTNDTAALARSQAVLRGRNATAAENIVRKSESFSAEESVKNKVADFVAADMPALMANLSGRAVKVNDRTLKLAAGTAESLVRVEMNMRQSFLHLVADPNISALLMALGGIAIYAEISSGFTLIVPGIFGLFCLLLGFVSLQTIPLNVGGVLLLALGLALLAAEAFVTSYGLLTITALVAIFIGGLFLVDPATTDMRVSLSLLIPLVGGIGIVMLGLGYVIYRDRRENTSGAREQVVGQEAEVVLSENEGRRGSAYVNGELWSFDSEESLKIGDHARVDSVEGIRLKLTRRK
jgi:membrane-bound serine protease (ClpP class)